MKVKEEVKQAEEVIRTQGFFDSGSDVDAIGENIVSYLELIGGQSRELSPPVEVRWLDKDVTRVVTKCMDLHVNVVGTEVNAILTFLVMPWTMDNLVVGWQTQEKFKVTDHLLDWIKMQRDMNNVIGNTW